MFVAAELVACDTPATAHAAVTMAASAKYRVLLGIFTRVLPLFDGCWRTIRVNRAHGLSGQVSSGVRRSPPSVRQTGAGESRGHGYPFTDPAVRPVAM